MISKYKIKKDKIIYLNGLVNDFLNIYNINLNKQKYILYDIDQYSGQNNLVLLTTWLKYFTQRYEKLIIIYKYRKDSIVKHNFELFKRGTFKNIILITDANADISNYNIFASIINTSYYSLTTSLYENIMRNRMILTVNDKITKGILKDKSCIMLDEFNEANIHNALNKASLKGVFDLKESGQLCNDLLVFGQVVETLIKNLPN